MFYTRSWLSLALCVAAISCVCSDEIEDSKATIRKEAEIIGKCMKQENISEDEVTKMLAEYELSDKRSTKCYCACYSKGMNYLSDDGTINWVELDRVHKIQYVVPAEENKALEVSKICKEKVGTKHSGDICEVGYQGVKCFLDEAKKRGLKMFGPGDL